jgi:hypothetical protein
MKELISAKAFLPDEKLLEQIINTCHLKPDSNNWRVWIDDAGNKLIIKKNKSMRLHAARMEGVTPTTTDLFFQSKPQNIARHSVWIHALTARADDTRVAYVWFMGHDLKLRLSYFIENVWNCNYPPLQSGIQTLKKVIQSYLTDDGKNTNNYNNINGVDIKPIAQISTVNCNWQSIQTWLTTN